MFEFQIQIVWALDIDFGCGYETQTKIQTGCECMVQFSKNMNIVLLNLLKMVLKIRFFSIK